jgi:hypothetical protein
MQWLAVILQSILLAIFLVQDTVNLAPFNNLPAQLRRLGWTKIIIGTCITAGCAAASLYLTIKYSGAPLPMSAKIFFVLWWGMLMLGMWTAWYKPYFLGPTDKELELYRQLFSGTHSVLPVRHGFPGPNTLHLFMHFFMMACAVLGFLKVAGVF